MSQKSESIESSDPPPPPTLQSLSSSSPTVLVGKVFDYQQQPSQKLSQPVSSNRCIISDRMHFSSNSLPGTGKALMLASSPSSSSVAPKNGSQATTIILKYTNNNNRRSTIITGLPLAKKITAPIPVVLPGARNKKFALSTNSINEANDNNNNNNNNRNNQSPGNVVNGRMINILPAFSASNSAFSVASTFTPTASTASSKMIIDLASNRAKKSTQSQCETAMKTIRVLPCATANLIDCNQHSSRSNNNRSFSAASSSSSSLTNNQDRDQNPGPNQNPRNTEQPDSVSLQRARPFDSAKPKRLFAKELRCMMYGFGDDRNPYTESVDMIEDLVLQFISDIAMRALAFGANDRIGVDDLMYILRKDTRKYSRLKDLLDMNHELRQARKAFDEVRYIES